MLTKEKKNWFDVCVRKFKRHISYKEKDIYLCLNKNTCRIYFYLKKKHLNLLYKLHTHK